MTRFSRFVKTRYAACLKFIDAHPRVGWYVAGITTLNLLLNALELVVK